jgi:diguanylate cyclase (GGDEF)-like protein
MPRWRSPANVVAVVVFAFCDRRPLATFARRDVGQGSPQRSETSSGSSMLARGLAPTISMKTDNNQAKLDWDALLVKVLPRRMLLAALLIALGVSVDLPWLGQRPYEVLAIRATMVAGAVLAAWVGRYCRASACAEALVVIGSLGQVVGMATLGSIEDTYLSYTSAVYQVLIFVVIFLPIRTQVYAGLVAAIGILWFAVFPMLLPVLPDRGLLASNAMGYLTYSIMLLAGNRLFLRLRSEELAKRVTLEADTGRLRELAIRDGLTGTFNFRHFRDCMPVAVAEAMAKRQPLCLCMLDLDGFKAINDRAGHVAGNAVLEQVGHALLALVRRGDQVFRIGGDEFAIVLPAASLDEARLVAARIQANLASLAPADQGLVRAGIPPLHCSIGIAGLSPPWSTADALVKAADQALYEAKRAGSMAGGRIVVAPAG